MPAGPEYWALQEMKHCGVCTRSPGEQITIQHSLDPISVIVLSHLLSLLTVVLPRKHYLLAMISSQCSQSWLHFWLWHVIFWTNKLCFQILSFSHPRHPSNLSSSSSFYSHDSCKFTCLQQTWLLQFTLLWHLTNKSQQTSTIFKIHWHVSLQTSKYQHIT